MSLRTKLQEIQGRPCADKALPLCRRYIMLPMNLETQRNLNSELRELDPGNECLGTEIITYENRKVPVFKFMNETEFSKRCYEYCILLSEMLQTLVDRT